MLFFALFYSRHLLFILFGLLLLILDRMLLLLLLLQPSRASWLCDVVEEVKLWAVAEEDGLLRLMVKDELLALMEEALGRGGSEKNNESGTLVEEAGHWDVAEEAENWAVPKEDR